MAARFIWTSPLATRSSPLLTFGCRLAVDAAGPTLLRFSLAR